MKKAIYLSIMLSSALAMLLAQGRGETKMENEKKREIPAVTEKAYLGGGCFWCIEAVYERIDGVYKAVSGYAGGETSNPNYQTVSSGKTGHAEVVEIEYDPSVVSYAEVLDMFWRAHDPTTLNRQGADIGTQYRSIILTTSEEQRKTALASMENAQNLYPDKIVTEVVDLEEFYVAEGYHQDYFDNNPYAGYCRVVIAPKLEKLDLPVWE